MGIADFMPGEAVVATIRKDIEAYEASRASALRGIRWRVPLFLGLLAAAVVVMVLLFNQAADPYEQWISTPHLYLYGVAFLVAFPVYFRAMKPAADARQSFRETLLPIVFGFIGNMRYRHGVKPESFDRLPRETVDPFSRQSFDDVVSGKYEDFPFELYETRLLEGAGNAEKTVFKGAIVAFEMIAPFPGVLVAARRDDAVVGFFRGIFRRKLENVRCGVPELDEAYEFWTDNAGAAGPLAAGRLAKALTWLGDTWPGGLARVALSGGDGFLLLPRTKDFFELPAISEPIDYRAHVAPMIADMGTILATAALVRKVGARDGEGTTSGTGSIQP